MGCGPQHYFRQLMVIFLPIKLLSKQTQMLIATFNSILMMSSNEIVCSIHHNYSNSLGQWYWYLILQCIMRICSLPISFSKLQIMKLLIVELYLILNGIRMITNNSVINYGVSSNNTLALFRIFLIILIFDHRNYIQVYYKIMQWHLIITFCKWKIMELFIIELYSILNGMIVNMYGVSSHNTSILFTILLIIFVCENRDYYYYIQEYYKLTQWNLINIDI